MFGWKYYYWILAMSSTIGVLCIQDISHDEDDYIINEVMSSTKPEITKKNGVPTDSDIYHSINQRDETEGARESKAAAAIVGDVNRYGLWEYNADNTGMGEQISKMMKKVENTDITLSAHDLEKQAQKMNEQINKYAEGNGDSANPTIDPMESPINYHPTAHQLSYAGPDLSPINHNKESSNDVDVVTIPNSMTIEDEHGNNLDTVQRFRSDNKPSKSAAKYYESNFPSNSVVINKPTPKLGLGAANPTTSLTQKLLVALRGSKSFRSTAQKLLPLSSDSETETFQKQRKLALFVKAYERMQDHEAPKSKIKIPRYDKTQEADDGTVSNKLPHDIRLLSVIKKLMKSDEDHAGQRNQLHDLLSALKTTEKDAAKTEHEFYDNSGKSNSKDANSVSDPYLKHFKEFIEKHKHPTEEETNSIQPLGTTNSASPLMGYLEQETAAVNNIKDAGEDPKAEVNKLEKMLIKQKSEQEVMQKEHDKIMLEQFKKLLKEGKENKEDGENKENNQEGTKQESSSKINDSDFGEDIYNTMKNSAEYQEFAASKANKYATGHTKDNTDESTERGDDSSDASAEKGDNASDSKFLEEQLKEIGMQRKLLKIKEYKLKELSKENQINKTTEKVESTPNLVENKNKDAEENEEKVDHLLHLARPKKYENNSTTDDAPEFKKIQTKEKSDEMISKNEENRKPQTNTRKESSKQITSSSNGEDSHSHDLESEEQFKMVDVHEEHQFPLNKEAEVLLEHGTKGKVDTPKFIQTLSAKGRHFKEAANDSAKHINKDKSNAETLGLPINNPSPKDDNGLEPHEHFHHNFHSKDDSDNSASKEPSDVKSPINASEDGNSHSHTKDLTTMENSEESRNMPPAGMGRPSASNLENLHVFPIEEPPPLISFHTDTNHHALKSSYETASAEKEVPNTISNLLKHKTIPSNVDIGSYEDLNIVSPSNLDASSYKRVIKPKSSQLKMVDVTASKKGFGKLPKKPKSYLLKELREKLKLYALKRHDIRFKNRLHKIHHTETPDIRDILLNLNNSNIQNTSRRHLRHKHSKHVLIPGHITNRIITINTTLNNQSQANVIVPGSDHSKLTDTSASAENNFNGNNPEDITRSLLPQITDKPKSDREIEKAFDILGSNDPITEKKDTER